jgi:hypothetical protein
MKETETRNNSRWEKNGDVLVSVSSREIRSAGEERSRGISDY